MKDEDKLVTLMKHRKIVSIKLHSPHRHTGESKQVEARRGNRYTYNVHASLFLLSKYFFKYVSLSKDEVSAHCAPFFESSISKY